MRLLIDAAFELTPEPAWVDNRHAAHFAEREKFLVAGDECVSIRCDSASEDRYVVRVFDFYRWDIGSLGDPALCPQQPKIAPNDRLREPELFPEHALSLLQDLFTNKELVFADNAFEQFGTEAAGGERTDENVGIQKHLHETSRNTSSSVR